MGEQSGKVNWFRVNRGGREFDEIEIQNFVLSITARPPDFFLIKKNGKKCTWNTPNYVIVKEKSMVDEPCQPFSNYQIRFGSITLH